MWQTLAETENELNTGSRPDEIDVNLPFTRRIIEDYSEVSDRGQVVTADTQPAPLSQTANYLKSAVGEVLA